MVAAKPRYRTEMSGRFRGGGAETVSMNDLPVLMGIMVGVMSGSR